TAGRGILRRAGPEEKSSESGRVVRAQATGRHRQGSGPEPLYSVRRALALLGILWLSGCAYVGEPKPPTLDMPARVTDLRAAEYGDKIIVEFTIGPLTTEGLAITELNAVELRAVAGSSSRILAVPAKGPGTVNYEFPAQDWIGKQVILTVRATGPKGKAEGG